MIISDLRELTKIIEKFNDDLNMQAKYFITLI